MSNWQTYVFDRLNINPHGKYIVIDHIGLLNTAAFHSFLVQENIRYSLARDVEEVLEGLSSTQVVIILPDLDLPAYLEHQALVIHFDVQRLPIPVEPDVLTALSLSDLADLIGYMGDAQIMQLIDKNNYQGYLTEAHRYFLQKELVEKRKALAKQSEQIEDYPGMLQLGWTWGRYIYLCSKIGKTPEADLIHSIDHATESLVLSGDINNAFYEPLKTVDRILSHIKRIKPDKFALICFDAMGVAEWQVLKEYLSDLEWGYEEIPLFALIPTMTLVSRSAIFYGDVEKVYDLRSPNEDKAFSENFPNYSVRSFREGDLNHPDQLLGITAVKIIYNVFDDLAHKTVLPPDEKTKGIYFENVLNYLDKSRIKEELRLLLDNDFKVWFCSDHGTVVATGNGKKIDKYLIETSCKRATIIEKSDLAEFYDVNRYEIPFVKNRIALLAKNRTSFSYINKREITHGGITLDELVVPFVGIIP